MCGHVGMAGDITFAHEKVLKTLFIFDTIRGEDSTGLAAVGKFTDEVQVAKEVGHPYELFDSRKFEQAMKGSNRVLIGHNRYATMGKVNRINAHPFDFDTLVGAHNGTLKNKWRLEDSTDFVVDSENLFHHIEKKGIDDAIDVAEGAWALVWWDKVTSELNFLRNEERTLFYCLSADRKVLFWASERWMLEVALMCHDVKHTPVELFPTDVLHTLPVKLRGELGVPRLRTVKHVPVNRYAPVVKNNVVELPKKEEKAAPLGKLEDGEDGLDVGYLSAKSVRFEMLALCSDEHGSKYISCFDKNHQGRRIRLYFRKGSHLPEMLGEEIIGDISGGGMQKGVATYKIDPWNVKLALEVDDLPDVDDEALEGTPMHPTHKTGVYVNTAEWHKRYPNCGNCMTDVEPHHHNAYTSGGDVICPACIDLAKTYTNLIFPSHHTH